MSKVLMVASAFAIAAALGASGAQAGGRHQSYGGGGLLGLKINVGDHIGVKANVGGSNGGHNGGGDSLLGLGLRIDGLANVKANVGGSNGHGGDSLLGLGARVDGLANVKANVGGPNALVGARATVGSSHPGQGLVNANVNVGGRQIENCNVCGGHDGGVGGGW